MSGQRARTEEAWAELDRLHAARRRRRIADLFAADPARAERMTLEGAGLALDLSRTLIDEEVAAALHALAEAADVAGRREAMFSGEAINVTERRAVLHVALRNLSGGPIRVGGRDVMEEVRATLARMEALARAVRSGAMRSAAGRPFRHVLNIGIGGSHLGPEMACRALAPFIDGPAPRFISNIDGAEVTDALAGLDPAETLVIVVSKTFTTLETMTNARTVRRWLAGALGEDGAAAQMIAVSSATDRAAEWGIPAERVFGFGEWVGGRYSVWGPVGLALMLAIGPERFRAFLAGAEAMDRHFRAAPPGQNLPLALGLAGVWHAQVCGHGSRAVIPYAARLARLPAYLQQLEMESNGKSVTLDGAPLGRDSVPVIWGEPGTDAQHAFFQALHQGTRVVPVEFILPARGLEPELDDHHRLLVANCLAQAEALMRGRSAEEVEAAMRAAGAGEEEAARLAPHRACPGNRPSVLILAERLGPAELGALIALYEHRVFVEGAVLGINSFDQWGVELGKEIAGRLAPALEGRAGAADPATAASIARIRRLRGEG